VSEAFSILQKHFLLLVFGSPIWKNGTKFIAIFWWGWKIESET
jgi:hypothetical protein